MLKLELGQLELLQYIYSIQYLGGTLRQLPVCEGLCGDSFILVRGSVEASCLVEEGESRL